VTSGDRDFVVNMNKSFIYWNCVRGGSKTHGHMRIHCQLSRSI